MTDPVYIARIQPDPEGLDFEGLKQSGIALLQALSGKAWTDYNLHDPGVTILEVLCYALTDLAYRTEFEVADFLTDPSGSINYEKQALFHPRDIFPNQAVTINDYRKLIYDGVSQIDNIWITAVPPLPASFQSPNLRGLYCISVMPVETAHRSIEHTKIERENRRQIKEDVRRLFLANRNLCEDLIQVNIVEPDYYSLQGVIEICGRRNPDDILAEIYFASSKYLGPGLTFRSYDAMLRQGKSLEEIFTGPLTEQGYISTGDLEHQPEYAQVSDLNGILSEIEGVEYVDALWFEDGLNFIEYDRTLQSMPCLLLPAQKDEVGVKLTKNGREHPIDLQRVRTEFERLKFEDQARRRVRQDIAKVCDPPQGEYRHFSDYYSIQHHFPETYGIGKQGVPAQVLTAPERTSNAAVYNTSARAWQLLEFKKDTARRQARAKQLKAYLLLFEQTMANYLANLQALAGLFSVDDKLDRSYFHQLLDEKIVPGIEEIYQEEAAKIDNRIGLLQGGYDNFRDRRNRILDYLLGIYGEHFTQNSLRRFKNGLSDRDFENEMILNKIALLKEIRNLSSKRAGAFNYLAKSWETENSATLNKKVNILLGLRDLNTRSLAQKPDTVQNEGCHVLEHILLRPLGKKYHRIQVPDDFYSFKISVLFPSWTRRFANREFRKLAEETVRLNCPAHIMPVSYWLEFDEMQEFETLYRHWLEKKRDPDVTVSQINEYALELIMFLIDHQQY